MKLRFIVSAALVGLAPFALMGANPGNLSKSAFNTDVKHNINGQGCKGCHAPHNGQLSNGGAASVGTNQGTGTIMLWSQKVATVTYGSYTSSTLTIANSGEIGGQTLAASLANGSMYSLLCLSCHDGITSTFNAPATMTAAEMVGSDTAKGGTTASMGLTNDHPVNLVYPATPTAAQGLQPLATVQAAANGGLPFFGPSQNSMQCATCHDAHNDVANGMYLRNKNDSTHCTTCHM